MFFSKIGDVCGRVCMREHKRANHGHVHACSRIRGVQNKGDGPKGFLSILHKLYLIFPSNPSGPKGLKVLAWRPQKPYYWVMWNRNRGHFWYWFLRGSYFDTETAKANLTTVFEKKWLKGHVLRPGKPQQSIPIRNKLKSALLFWKGQEVKLLAVSCLSPPPSLTPRTSHSRLCERDSCCQVLPLLCGEEPGIFTRGCQPASRSEGGSRGARGLSVAPQCQLSVYKGSHSTRESPIWHI